MPQRIAGKITTGGNTVQLNLALASGKGGKGTVSQNGTTFGLVVTGGSVYIKGSAAFYRQIGGKAAVQLFGGKWLKAPASGQYASISQLTDLQTRNINVVATRKLAHINEASLALISRMGKSIEPNRVLRPGRPR